MHLIASHTAAHRKRLEELLEQEELAVEVERQITSQADTTTGLAEPPGLDRSQAPGVSSHDEKKDRSLPSSTSNPDNISVSTKRAKASELDRSQIVDDAHANPVSTFAPSASAPSTLQVQELVDISMTDSRARLMPDEPVPDSKPTVVAKEDD